MLDSFKNYYAILNVPETASHDEIKAAFRRMARLYSPDVNPDPSVVRHFEEVLEAWGVLSDPAFRKTYDQSRGVWSPADYGPSSGVGRRQEDTPPPPVSTVSSPPIDYTRVLGRSPRRQASRERNVDLESYFDRGEVPLLVLLSLFLLGLAGWLRLESLTAGRGVLKAFLQGAVWGAFFWISFWGLRFHAFAQRSGRRGLAFFYASLSGGPYAFLVRWFLADVRSSALPFGLDLGVGYLSFVGIFALFADALEPGGFLLSRMFRRTEEPDDW